MIDEKMHDENLADENLNNENLSTEKANDERSTDPVPEWKTVARNTLVDCRIFQVEAWQMRRLESPSASQEIVTTPGTDARFHIIRCPDWVNVVAITPEDEIVLIEQYRIGVERVTLEIPGGMVDPGETPEAAAVRELREETGYSAQTWFALGSIEPNPAIQTNRCFTYLALGAKKEHDTAFDHHEFCRTRLEPFDQVLKRIAQGDITHALVVVALHYEQLRRQGVLSAVPLARG